LTSDEGTFIREKEGIRSVAGRTGVPEHGEEKAFFDYLPERRRFPPLRRTEEIDGRAQKINRFFLSGKKNDPFVGHVTLYSKKVRNAMSGRSRSEAQKKKGCRVKAKKRKKIYPSIFEGCNSANELWRRKTEKKED